MIYLKTYFYSPHEIKFLKLNLLEAYDYIDKFIICEYNMRHTGLPSKNDYIFEEHINEFPEELRDKIIYLKCDIKDKVIPAYDNEHIMLSHNVRLMRGYFQSQLEFEDEDIVISVEADEIIYGHKYPDILKSVEQHGSVALNLWQFFYKPNYLWINKDWVAPNIAKFKEHKNEYPANWRYGPITFPERVGCHFCYCMSVDEMIVKLLESFPHVEHRKCANREILENAIKTKKWPFDDREFEIKELNDDTNLWTENMRKMFSTFKN